MYSTSQNLIYLLLLLLLSRPPGILTYIIKVPTDYMALQGHLIVHLIFPQKENIRKNSNVQESNKILEELFRKMNESTLEERLENEPSDPLDNSAEFGETLFNKQRSFINSLDSFVESREHFRNQHPPFKRKIKAFSNQETTFLNKQKSNLENSHRISKDEASNSSFVDDVSNINFKNDLRNHINFWDSSPSSSLLSSSKASSSSSDTVISSMFISLFVLHQKKPLMRLTVPPEGNQTTFVFPCGTVANGGLHVIRLMKNKKILAESPRFNVSWPHMVIDIPIRLETYRSPADIQFSFIKAHSCSSKNANAFKTWAELLYHGSDSPRITPTRFPTSVLRQIFDSGEEERNKRSHIDNVAKHSGNGNSSTNRTSRNSESVVPSDIDVLNSDIKYSKNIDSLLEQSQMSDGKSKDAISKNDSRNIIPLTSRPKRMYTLSSLEGSTIPSMSNTNIKPAALKMWSWENMTNAQVVQRVPVIGDLYSQAEFNVRFSCEVVGPAGLYSVRIVTDVPSSPVIAESNTFPVDWAEEFTLHIQRLNIIPCMSPVLVTYTRPLCVGKQEKIRLFAQVRANVTSANPPISQRYITERRATNHSTYFDCELFTDEPTEYCFVYVNTAKSGAVSVARSQCVATFKPGVLRIDGQWGEWSHWTECTTTCGSGTRIRHRFCNNPAPRNGGLFCVGQSLASVSCGDSTCINLSLPVTIPSSALPPLGNDNECLCGCYLTMAKDFEITLSTTAADCTGTSTWIFEGPVGTVISGELLRAALLPGFQWLKVRDGNSSFSPLLLALPSFRSLASHKVSERVTSSARLLLVKFRSDVNSSFIGSVWGFRLKIWASSPATRRLVWSALEVSIKRNLVAFHVVVLVLGSCVLVAIAGYSAYYCRRYQVYTKSKLILDDSPMETPEGSPVHDFRRDMVASAASVATFTEVLSLKSLKLSLRKSSSSSYTRLARDGDFGYKGVRPMLRSLPASPLMSIGRLPMSIRRSSTQLTRILKMGNKKRINRRSASFDHLRSNISPIDEDTSLPNSLTMEQISNNKTFDKAIFVEQEKKLKEQETGTGEDNSNKYKEYRKSLLMSKELCDKVDNLPRTMENSKLSKDKVNKDKMNKEILCNRKDNALKESTKDTTSCSSGEGVMRAASSVSQLSVTSGVDMEMEIDYYDYDVGNASAVPGSLFGMDPTLMPWLIDIDDLDIKSPDELVNETNRSTPVNGTEYGNTSILISPPPLELNPKPEEIQLQLLNFPPVSPDPLHQSSTSNESNSSSDNNILNIYVDHQTGNEEGDDDELTPRIEPPSSTPEENMKILNIHDVDDFQFADDSDDDQEDVIYNK